MLRTLVRSRPGAICRKNLSPHVHHERTISNYKVIQHTIPCSHSRDRPAGAELGRENELQLHVKQYIPHNNEKPKPGDVTILGAAPNSFPKEMLEPYWDDLFEALKAQGRKIRSIWIADMVNQGQSGILNETILGPDPSWYDHSRDLLNLINQHQQDFPHPIIGIGASVGGSQLVHLALMHPRLLHALVLIDPVLQLEHPSKDFAPAGTYRRDIWPSREAASESFSRSPFYQKWDPRVLERWTKYGLRNLPTEQYPSNPYSPAPELTSPKSRSKTKSPDIPAVTLTTPKAQEVYMYVRPAYVDPRLLQRRDQGQMHHEMHYNDIDVSSVLPFYRPEPASLFRKLHELLPDVLYLCGSESRLAKEAVRKARRETTGSGVGGSGGERTGQVVEKVLEGCGHLVAFERAGECAERTAEWMEEELFRWDAEEQDRKLKWNRLSRQERVGLNEMWRDRMPEPEGRRKKKRVVEEVREGETNE